ncbi:hypothetical protein [Elizabethkingia sp. JS20170427COW]|uniref:hypothetical protein n=1 Tax=Elizabethkingia sp. JS20170427COW TaxID=2583851 RepID=UPI0011107FDA|nr:hypothetical protein [Elizabethkingia sp. JS20170427COW]QCX53849.1 hypothetical protein FGE20_08965 [Elizabethkingia sp. JS20170427COW]
MKKLFIGILICTVAIACKNEKNKAEETMEETIQIDSLATSPADSTNTSTKVDIDNNGPLFISNNKEYRFRLIKKDKESRPETILLRNETSARIYKMERVMSVGGEKYQDLDGNYIWIKDKGFTFGKLDKIITEGAKPNTDSLQ